MEVINNLEARVGDFIVYQGPHYQIRYMVIAVIRWDGNRQGFDNTNKVSYNVSRYGGFGGDHFSEIQLSEETKIVRVEEVEDTCKFWRGDL